jgi:hypothetical protein
MKTCNWVRFVAAVAAILTICSLGDSVRAEEAVGNAASPGADAAKKPASKDPTASAFALPNGVTLNAKQQAAFDQLKADKQPELQQAIDDLQSSKTASGKAAKKVRDLRAEIRKKINDIIYTPSKLSSDAGGNTSNGSSPVYGYNVPYGGYYPYWPYGGYYPYLYRQRTTDGKTPGTKSGTNAPPRQQASRPAGSSSSSSGAKR